MIINIRGTNGSGKSTIVKEVIKLSSKATPIRRAFRRQPIGYLLEPHTGPSVWIVGHYETATGGTDTISKMDDVYEFVHDYHHEGLHVLFEGIMVSGERKRAIKLHQEVGDQFLVLALSTPIDECIQNVLKRRLARGDTTPLDPSRTKARSEEVRRMMGHLQNCGVNARWVTREEALAESLKLIGIS